MEIFNNRQRSGYEEIISYGPRWLNEYREMNANYRFAGWTLDLMAYFLERIINNQFPAHADEKAISLFEKILKISPRPEDSLEERRRTVAAYYAGSGKLSKSVIQSIIKTYTACDSDIWWSAINVLQIRVYANGEFEFSNSKIADIISRRMPAHIAFALRYLLCAFELEENYSQRIRYRLPVVWWSGCLDGSIGLEGTAKLNTGLPPFFIATNRVKVRNIWEPHFVSQIYTLPEATHTEEATFVPSHRTEFIWWHGREVLDGERLLDGSATLAQETPPAFTKVIHAVEINNDEDISVFMYNPAISAVLDGGSLLDGTLNLNSGREEL